MKRGSSIWILLWIAGLLALPMATAHAITIDYFATDLENTSSDEDLWQYTYTVSDRTFAVDTGFTIYFNFGLYDLLDPAPAAPNAEWGVTTWDPDPFNPDDGAYDAYALVDEASLVDSFTVSFVWLGSGTPGTQYFDVYDANTWDTLEYGATAAAPVPEPATFLLLSAGLVGLGIRKRINGMHT